MIKMDELQNSNKHLLMTCNDYDGKVVALGEICRCLRNSVEKISEEKYAVDGRLHKIAQLEERVQELQAANKCLESKLISYAHDSSIGHSLNADPVGLEVLQQNIELKSKCE